MFTLTLFLAAIADPVSLDDLARLPDRHLAAEQLCRCERHRETLLWLRYQHGYGDGRWDWWIADMDRRCRYWYLLEQAHQSPFGHGEEWRVGRLRLLRGLVGEADYLAGWFPEEIPDLEPPQPQPDSTRANNR